MTSSALGSRRVRSVREGRGPGPVSSAVGGLTSRATPEDVDAIGRLIAGYAARGLMLPRSAVEIADSVGHFRVVRDQGGRLRGCGGLRVYHEGLAEVVALAVAEDARGRGLGGQLVGDLLEDAWQQRIGRVFAMTLAEGFFHAQGFRTIPRASLPEKEARDCRTCALREGCMERAVVIERGPGGWTSRGSRRLQVLASRSGLRPDRSAPA